MLAEIALHSAVPETITNMLIDYKKITDAKKEVLGDLRQWPEHDFLFTNDYGKPLRPDSIARWWERFIPRHELKKIRFHDLRHTSASVLFSMDVKPKVIQERLGHSKIGTTLDIYTHLLKNEDETAAANFDSFLVNRDRKSVV